MGQISSPESVVCSTGSARGSFLKNAAAVERGWLVKKVVLCASPIEQPLLSVFEHQYLTFEVVRHSDKRFFSVEKVRAPRPEDTVLLHDGPTFASVFLRYGAGRRRVPQIREAQTFRPSKPIVDLLRYVNAHMLTPYQLVHDDCCSFAEELYDLACVSCGERVPLTGIAGIAVRPVSLRHKEDERGGDGNDLCERYNIGENSPPTEEEECRRMSDEGAVCRDALTLEEWVQTRCSSRPDRQNVYGSCVDIAYSNANPYLSDRLSDADWNVVEDVVLSDVRST
jgi:hypothetical protein